MCSHEMLLYLLFTIGTLYGLWITMNVVWELLIKLYHYITDEISFYKFKRKRRD